MILANPSGHKPSVHFSGIGGTAMVAGARLALEAGWEVRGSDNPLYPPTSDMVAALGVPVATGYAAENLDWNPDYVILGNALSRGNPEVEAALERGMNYISFAEWLKDAVLRERVSVALCGTHGKTTTTALTAWLLDQCGMEPGYFVGGQPLNFAHSARLCPPGRPFVVEGDEYDTAFFDKRAKFFHYLPRIAVVTSVEFDHGDIYPDLDAIVRAFRLMMRQIPASGWALLCADNPGARELRSHAPCQTALYGFDGDAEWRGVRTGAREGFQLLDLYHRDALFGSFEVPLAGRHNLQNSIAALAVGAILGATPDALRTALHGFKGVRRRMEVFHEARGMVFVDDFAHHPTAIRETVAAARMRWPERRLVALFEPRSNTTVTRAFQVPLLEAFQGADVALVGPIHRIERIAPEDRLDREQLCADLRGAGVSADAFDSTGDMLEWIKANGRNGDLMLFMSNGAFGGLYGDCRSQIVD